MTHPQRADRPIGACGHYGIISSAVARTFLNDFLLDHFSLIFYNFNENKNGRQPNPLNSVKPDP